MVASDDWEGGVGFGGRGSERWEREELEGGWVWGLEFRASASMVTVMARLVVIGDVFCHALRTDI